MNSDEILEAGIIVYASLLTKREEEWVSDVECPLCGGHHITISGRCKTCQDCGWSTCEL